MNRFGNLVLISLVLVSPTGPAYADKKEPKKDPKADLPVRAKMVVKKAIYGLDLGGKTPEEYLKFLKDNAKNPGKLPAAPDVDLVLELTNTTKKDLTIWVAGDRPRLNLLLKGKGALSLVAQSIFPKIYYPPKAVTLPPGKSYQIAIKRLQYGFRMAQMRAYWTKPGEYTLTATFTTAIKPAPKGSDRQGNGFGLVTLTSNPVKIKVRGK
jgi:hypothetical protein